MVSVVGIGITSLDRSLVFLLGVTPEMGGVGCMVFLVYPYKHMCIVFALWLLSRRLACRFPLGITLRMGVVQLIMGGRPRIEG